MPDVFVKKNDEPKNLSEAKPASGGQLEVAKKHFSPFSHYCKNPSGIYFSEADKEEEIVLIVRKHLITNIPWVIIGVLLLFAPIPFVYFPILNFLPERFLIVAILFWYLVSMAYTLEKFISWFFNVNIVTDERVFDVDFHNLVDRDISDANIEDIQDVTSTIRGAIRTSFDYGDILIQTAAEIPQIELAAVPHPDEIAKILRELRIEEEQEKVEGRVR